MHINAVCDGDQGEGAGALTLPVALRLPRQPLLGFLVQAVASCLWHPYPSASHVALYLVAQLCCNVLYHVLGHSEQSGAMDLQGRVMGAHPTQPTTRRPMDLCCHAHNC